MPRRAGWFIGVVFSAGLVLAACTAAPPDALRGLLPSPAGRYVAEGDRLSAAGRAAEAILAYRQAVTRDERHVPALRKLARAYAAQGRRRLALAYARTAAALQPGDADITADLEALASPVPGGPLEQAWLAPAGVGAPAGMAVGDGAVYVAYEDGRVRALDAGTGGVQWEIRLSSQATSSPEAGGGLVLVGGGDGALYALDAADGRDRWRYQTAAPIYASPLMTPEIIYVPSGDGSLSALAPADGSLLWKIDAVGPLTGRPSIDGGLLFFGAADGRIFGVDARTGQELWGSGIVAQGPVESQPAVNAGRVFVGAGDSRVYALAAATGGEYWRHSTPDAIYARPLVVSDTVFVASAGNTLSALDALSGELKWELTASTALRHAPALVGDTLLFAAAADPNLYAVDAGTGHPLWQLDTGDWLAGGPVVSDGMIFLLGQDGAVAGYTLAR